MKIYSWKNKFYNLLSCLIFLIIWQIAACIINNDIFIPRIDQILNSLRDIVNNKNFAVIVLSTFVRTCISYLTAMFFAMIFGVLCFTCPVFNYVLMPFNSLCKTVPTLVLVVLALVWFDKDKAPFIVGFAIVFPILFEGIRNSFEEISSNIMPMTKISEAHIADKIFKIYIPKIKFYIMSISVSTFSLALKVVIAGEVHGQPKFGIGSEIQIEKMNFNTCGIFAWIIIIILISLMLDCINHILYRRVYRWKYEDNN